MDTVEDGDFTLMMVLICQLGKQINYCLLFSLGLHYDQDNADCRLIRCLAKEHIDIEEARTDYEAIKRILPVYWRKVNHIIQFEQRTIQATNSSKSKEETGFIGLKKGFLLASTPSKKSKPGILHVSNFRRNHQKRDVY